MTSLPPTWLLDALSNPSPVLTGLLCGAFVFAWMVGALLVSGGVEWVANWWAQRRVDRQTDELMARGFRALRKGEGK